MEDYATNDTILGGTQKEYAAKITKISRILYLLPTMNWIFNLFFI